MIEKRKRKRGQIETTNDVERLSRSWKIARREEGKEERDAENLLQRMRGKKKGPESARESREWKRLMLLDPKASVERRKRGREVPASKSISRRRRDDSRAQSRRVRIR